MGFRSNAAELVAETVPALGLKLSHFESLCAERGRQVKQLCGGMGGRPRTQRTDAELLDVPQSTASHCKVSMTQRMLEVLSDGKMATTAVVAALRLGGYLQAVWESEVFWELRVEWVTLLKEDLSLAWSAEQSMNI